MAVSEKWRIAQRGAIPKSIIYRGHRYKLDGKYPSLSRAADRIKKLSHAVTRRVLDKHGKVKYAVYKR